LILSASVAGLGNVPSAEFSLVGTADVSSRCYTKSGNKPQAANKQETISVDQTETFPVRNGRTNATFTVTPLSTLDCPGGQVVVIESVTYDLALTYMGTTLYTFTSGMLLRILEAERASAIGDLHRSGIVRTWRSPH
jgi:hypothetical protein